MFAGQAKLAGAMRGNFEPEGMRSKVGHLAQEVDRAFGVAILQFSVRRAHAAHGFQPASGAFGGPGGLSLANFEEEFVPTLFEATLAQVIQVDLREDADAHLAIGIYRERSQRSAALIQRSWPLALGGNFAKRC